MQGRERWGGWEGWTGEAQEEDTADREEHCKPPGAVRQHGSLQDSIWDGAWGGDGAEERGEHPTWKGAAHLAVAYFLC